MALNTPILFLVFNRPETTELVFEAIRKAKPTRLYVASDGPRTTVAGEAAIVEKVRNIATQVDWNCEVKTLFRVNNCGCGKACPDAITWFFEHEEMGIILEDDTLPDYSFFLFCQQLLDKFKNDERVMLISGDNFQFGKNNTNYSYYFSKYPYLWGWATWKRTWNLYDKEMGLWPEIRSSGWFANLFKNKIVLAKWENLFDKAYKGLIDSWDYELVFSCWINNGLSIVPKANLVSNIGFGESATHTKKVNKYANLKAQEIIFPLQHPPFLIRHNKADEFTDIDNFASIISIFRYFSKANIADIIEILHNKLGGLGRKIR